jgi:DNA-binding winged helix-turn-helix (wHTH) protein/tetratricopeptide (TPR) repeat protein
MKAKHLYQFGPFQIDTFERLLLHNGEPVPLTPKAFETLLMLVEKSGHLVGKEELIKRVWPDTFVDDNSLTRNISVLRKLLANNKENQEYIETVPKFGYRFVGEVKFIQEEQSTTRLKSVAVIPFKSLSLETNKEYLGLGIADALITKFSNLKQIVVRPTSTIRKYLHEDIDPIAVGKELGVEYILDGTIQIVDDKMRLTAQLIETDHGTTLWADKFGENFTDILSVQDSISEQVVNSLILKLSDEERLSLSKRYSENNEAYQEYLKGLYHSNKRTSEGLKRSINYFKSAIKKDSQFALAYAALADSYALLSFNSILSPKESLPKAMNAAKKAVKLDSTLAEAHVALAQIKTCFSWDWIGAEFEYKQAIAINPNSATAHHKYSILLTALGRHVEAIAEIKHARELDPLSLIINASLGSTLFYARQYDEAIDQLKHTLEMDQNFVHALERLGHVYLQKGMYEDAISAFQRAVDLYQGNLAIRAGLGSAYALAGKPLEARKILEQIMELSNKSYISAYDIALLYAALGNKDHAFKYLQKAFRDRYYDLIALKVEPGLDSLRSDPRFTDLMKQVGLLDYKIPSVAS